MRLRRIEIRNFRKFLDPIVIDGIDDRLTVISGDNEDGKSTVLAALQAVLFERHAVRGEVAERMQPRGRDDLRPELAIEFDGPDGHWRLAKSFRIKPLAQLEGPGGRFAGAAAEERLFAMLGVEGGARGAAKPEQRGTWGLLWVEQGTAFAALRPGERTQATLATALEGEVGQVLGGERGRKLFAAVADAQAALVTEIKREPRGVLKDALDQVETLTAERDRRRAELDGYRRQVDEFARARRELDAMVRDDTLGKLRRELEAARHDAAAVQEARQRERAAASELAVAEANLAAATDRWTLRKRHIDRLNEAQKSLVGATNAQKAAQAALAPFTKALEQARERRRTMQRDFEAASAHHLEVQRAIERSRSSTELARRTERLNRAQAAAQAAAKARADAKLIKVDDARLASIQKLERSLAEQRARLGVSATRVVFAPDGRKTVRRDGAPVESELLVTERASFELEGFGTVTVVPGGEELQRRAREVEAAEARLRTELTAVGMNSADDAVQAGAERRRLLAEADAQERLVAAHAPESVARLAEEISALGPDPEHHKDAVGDQAGSFDAAALPEAERARTRAQQALHASEDALRRLEADHAVRREALVGAQARLQGAEPECDRIARSLVQERESMPDETLLAAVAGSDRMRQVAMARRQASEADVVRLDAAAIDIRLKRLEEAHRSTTEEFDRRSRDVREREIDLNAQGVTGLGEMLAECEGKLARAQRDAARLRREADALMLLHDTLLAAQREAKERFLEPVTRRIKPYLRLLFPDSEIMLDEANFALSGVRRGVTSEPFESLSLGTREQLAVLVRLGFAELLLDKGRPAPVILDDALVYADPDRFARMLDILHSAAERLQIIVLTCRERDWRESGARMISLADCRVPA